ncbi:Rne/Rng family ribonuclease [Anaplasma bovis]
MSSGGAGKRILVDAVYVDEIRVAVLDGGKVVEFDQELKDKKQLRGNIYHAVVKRIEPSLQAVFIEYGVGKHGFLPFSEIAVNYYQLPDEEKEALLQSVYGDEVDEESAVSNVEANVEADEQSPGEDAVPEAVPEVGADAECVDRPSNKRSGKSGGKGPSHKYKVQNVIKVDQELMVQVIKEERGNKCATFSTYVVLVGRYCVLMPNSGTKHSGISRRIEDCDSRKCLKEVLSSMKLPKECGVIIRTAGSSKGQKEIEQDLRYLQSLWSEISESCASLEAPALLYAEANIMQRVLRDFCDESTHDVVVAGDEAFNKVKEYARSMFGNKLRVRMYKGAIPIFTHYRVNAQILELYTDKVHLPSGGYLVITPTEALVSVDVNSGRMTGEDSIEETAYKTNMEAVKEIARQVNLRGLSGLIVVDFIDMVKYRYCRAVEAEVREAFKGDKAKIQFGYISAFGLMEISRQRVKQSILDTNTVQCSHCKGVGRVRSLESISADILRDIRYLANKNCEKVIVVVVSPKALSHIFNSKRKHVSDIESEFRVLVRFDVDENMPISGFSIRAEGGYVSNNEGLMNSQVVNGSSRKVDVEDSPAANSAHNAAAQQQDTQQAIEVKAYSATWVSRWLARIFDAAS